jgi:Mg-chelatase subunit ChlD
MKDATHIAVLLDRSGSMESVKDETISGYNAFIKEQKEAGDNASLSLVQFDSAGIDTLQEFTPISAVPDLNGDTFQPRGMTPLLDALGKTINTTGKSLEAIPEANRPDKVVFVVITDGQENASHEFNKTHIKEMIEHQSSIYNWQFIYLGANQDAFAEAADMGITVDCAANFVGAAMGAAAAATSSNVANYRRTGRAASLNYSSGQRARMMSPPKKPRLPK